MPRRAPKTIWDLLLGILDLLIQWIEAIRDRDKPATTFEFTIGPVREKRD